MGDPAIHKASMRHEVGHTYGDQSVLQNVTLHLVPAWSFLSLSMGNWWNCQPITVFWHSLNWLYIGIMQRMSQFRRGATDAVPCASEYGRPVPNVALGFERSVTELNNTVDKPMSISVSQCD